MTQVRSLEQDAARLEGETAEHLAELAQVRGSLVEAKAQILQVQHDFREKVVAELRDVVASILELREERVAAMDRLGRIEIRSPVAGFVHGLEMHTVGGVIAATEPVMQIIPLGERLIVDSRVSRNTSISSILASWRPFVFRHSISGPHRSLKAESSRSRPIDWKTPTII